MVISGPMMSCYWFRNDKFLDNQLGLSLLLHCNTQTDPSASQKKKNLKKNICCPHIIRQNTRITLIRLYLEYSFYFSLTWPTNWQQIKLSILDIFKEPKHNKMSLSFSPDFCLKKISLFWLLSFLNILWNLTRFIFKKM